MDEKVINDVLAQLHLTQGVAADPTLDDRTRKIKLMILCKQLTHKFDVLFGVLDDIERHKPATRDRVNAVRIKLRALKVEFTKLSLELNFETL